MRQKLSVVIITLNEEARIARCLKSVSFADEIIVVDSGSTDATREISESHGANFFDVKWRGYGRQKQYATDLASNDWVLNLDADEWLSQELKKSILQELEAPKSTVYEITRRNFFLGKPLAHGEGYPDRIYRLYQRTSIRWADVPVHEKIIFSGVHGVLDGDLLHDSGEGYREYMEKQDRYSVIQAWDMIEEGRSEGIMSALISGVFRFIRGYVFKLGFLDGEEGLKHIYAASRASFRKKYLVWRYRRLIG